MDFFMKPSNLYILLIIPLLICGACSLQTMPTAHTQVPAQVRNLTVLAAASLTESFAEIGRLFETQNPGIRISFSFAGSQQIAQQLGQGAPADVFASASPKYMDAAVQVQRVAKDSAKIFVRNRLVVIFPKDNPAGIQQLSDLAKPGIKLDFGDKSVPFGQYALDFLDKAVKDPAFGADFKNNVLKNVVSYEDNVKAVVTKVSLDEVDGGIVYTTDITGSATAKIDKLDIPDALNVIASYPIATTTDSQYPDLARAFVDLVLSKEGQTVLAKYNFIPINP
jgi:molybdate transport system substrate-binding protein